MFWFWLQIILLLALITCGMGFVWRRYITVVRAKSRDERLADELAFIKGEIGLDGEVS